jgi:hypothetical protein
MTDYAANYAWFLTQLKEYPLVGFVDASKSSTGAFLIPWSRHEGKKYCADLLTEHILIIGMRAGFLKDFEATYLENPVEGKGWYRKRGWPPGFGPTPIVKIDYMKAVRDIIGR